MVALNLNFKYDCKNSNVLTVHSKFLVNSYYFIKYVLLTHFLFIVKMILNMKKNCTTQICLYFKI